MGYTSLMREMTGKSHDSIVYAVSYRSGAVRVQEQVVWATGNNACMETMDLN